MYLLIFNIYILNEEVCSSPCHGVSKHDYKLGPGVEMMDIVDVGVSGLRETLVTRHVIPVEVIVKIVL